ncbi:MAG: beta-galactosidase, partial [Candidatus Latescibacteria bacterium]|nr:beta-galactosidase [Candidatus Latescibacterota bacterium]
MPIHAWIGPPAEQTSYARYKELADAGFTHSFSGFPDADAMQKALDVAKAAGIQLFVHIPELKSDPEGTVKRFKDHPALAGYHLRDEPNAKDFPELAAWVQRIRAVDDDHFCYINLFPNYASAEQLGNPSYREHVELFVKTVPVQVLSFDHYPVMTKGLRPEWSENLEIISEAARKAGKPFWAFALAVAHDPYPIPSIDHLRLQVYSNLAYGAQGIQYFTYWTPKSTRWNFHEGPIDFNGKRTVVYDRVKKVNEEIRNLSG